MSKDKIDIRPFLVKVGAAVALSFAGFFYSQLKDRTKRSCQPPHPPCFPDHDGEADAQEVRAMVGDDCDAVTKALSSSSVNSFSAERHEDRCMVKVTVDNSTAVLSPSSRYGGEKDGCLLPEFNDLVKDFDFTTSHARIFPKKCLETQSPDVMTPKVFRTEEENDYELEIRYLKNMVTVLQERERNLEIQLLEYYGLKEQEAAMTELQNHLKISNMEAKFLTLKIESLQADNQQLQSQVADYTKVATELDAAQAKIKMLKKTLRYDAEKNKEQILTLHKRVSRLQEQELVAATADSHAQDKLPRLKELEAEVEELRKCNSKLQLENSELACQLESTQILANCVLEDPETEALRQLSNQLRLQNKELAEYVEQLQLDRCTDLEELVYLRWINACLRYELRNYQPPHGQTVARDLSKSLSPRSEEKVKRLILEYANTEEEEEKEINFMDFESFQWPSSHASCITDLGDIDDSFKASKTSGQRKTKFFHKLRRLVRGKDVQIHDNGSNLGGEESDSPRISSSMSMTTDTTSDLQSNKLQMPPLNLSRHSSRDSLRHSLDIQRMRSPKIDDTKDGKNCRRNSDVSHSFRDKRTSWGSDFSVEGQANKDSSSFKKDELLKFAEVLEDSGSIRGNSHRKGKLHKRSASFGSFETLHHKNVR